MGLCTPPENFFLKTDAWHFSKSAAKEIVSGFGGRTHL